MRFYLYIHNSQSVTLVQCHAMTWREKFEFELFFLTERKWLPEWIDHKVINPFNQPFYLDMAGWYIRRWPAKVPLIKFLSFSGSVCLQFSFFSYSCKHFKNCSSSRTYHLTTAISIYSIFTSLMDKIANWFNQF